MKSMHRTYQFTNGRMVKSEQPEWFSKAIKNTDDWHVSLTKSGAVGLEDIGDGAESIDIYEAPDGSYFIGYWDAAKCVAEIFIDNVPDYLVFRANYIAPLASLIMESERHYEWKKKARVA